ncbi:MAG: DUF2254 domain-containing protein, partial [Pseudoalteromonas sp.]
NILEAFKNILFTSHKYQSANASLFIYLYAIVDDINEHITNEYDRNQVNNMLKSISRISPEKGEKLAARFNS